MIEGIFRLLSPILFCETALVIAKSSPHSTKPKKEDDLAIPLPAIILLSVLGFCLVLFAILYKFIRLEKCCQGDTKDEKKSKKYDKAHYAELGQVDAPSEAEEDNEDQSDFVSLTVSNPAHSVERLQYGGRTRSKSSGTTGIMKKPMDRRYYLGVGDRSSKVVADQTSDVGRVRSESDLSVGASASEYNARYSSWGYGLKAPSPRDKRAMSAYGDLTSMRLVAEQKRGVLARLQVSLSYAPTAQRLEIEAMRVEDVSEAVIRSGLAREVAVHISILPSKRSRFKTKAKSINSPSFHERWVIRNVAKKELSKQQLRFRLYSCEFLGKSRILGESIVDVMSFDFEDVGATKWLTLYPTSEIKKLMKI